jgi:hypothetical protein
LLFFWQTHTHTHKARKKKKPKLSDGTRGIFFSYFFYSFLVFFLFFFFFYGAGQNDNTYRVCVPTCIRRKKGVWMFEKAENWQYMQVKNSSMCVYVFLVYFMSHLVNKTKFCFSPDNQPTQWVLTDMISIRL